MEHGEEFIAERYPDTESSPERAEIIDEQLANENLTQEQHSRLEERSKSLPERLATLEGNNPAVIDRLIDRYTQEATLDITDEALLLKLARALYNSEKKIAINRGQGGEEIGRAHV